jgi:hypothetical protein
LQQLRTIQATEKKIITSAEQLPRRSYKLSRLPSELIDAPKSELDAVANALDADIASDLDTLDIQDRATRTGMLQARAAVAMHRGELRVAQDYLRQIRAQQDKAADKLTSGVLVENILGARLQGGSLDQQRANLKAALAQSWGAMPWATVGDGLKSTKGSLELISKNVAVGSIKTGLDPLATNLELNVPSNIVVALISVRNQFELIQPFRDDAVAVLQELVDRNQVTKPDKWTQRLVSLPSAAKGKPVVIGIWDSGTDVGIFQPAKVRGVAFDKDMNPVEPLVRPLGEAQSRLPAMKQYIKGSLDVRAAIDSADARALKQRIGTLQTDEVKQFSEDMSAIGMWVHGTHVAGIAVEGNPFARVTAVAMHWSSDSVPAKLDEASAKRTAAAYRAAVESFEKAGARVVNMSWRYGPGAYEGALAYHNIGGTPEERKVLAKQLFDIEKQALESAIAGAPQILFVAGAGNEDNNADFVQYIPAGLELPNLITVGAVDQAGEETSFSSFGKTVVVHANGFEVASYAPGGEQLKLSGTSMASPQVANLAGKLFAMRPDLTVAQVKELIMKGAERNGRVNMIHPKATLKLAGVKLEGK